MESRASEFIRMQDTNKNGDTVCDIVTEHFGIRVLTLDPSRGFQINGETVKLRGACIHHDNGIIGAETFAEAEWYRCKCLKEAGLTPCAVLITQ